VGLTFDRSATSDEQLRQLLAQPEVADVPYASRTDVLLRDECKARGIAPSSSRATVINRLEMHDADQPVVTTEALKATPRDTPAAFRARMPAPVFATGDMHLLGLPHPIVQLIFERLGDADVRAMLYLCKYTQGDAHAVLSRRAVYEFGAGATPLALSAYYFYWQLLHSTRITKIEKWKRRGVAMVKRMHRHGLDAYAINDVERDLRGDDLPNVICWTIERTVAAYGSIEAVLQAKQSARELKQLKASEDALRFAQAVPRYDACVALLAKHGLPAILHSYNAETGAIVLQPYFESLRLIDNSLLHHIKQTFSRYIRHGSPTLLATLQRQCTTDWANEFRVLAAAKTFFDAMEGVFFDKWRWFRFRCVYALFLTFHATPFEQYTTTPFAIGHVLTALMDNAYHGRHQTGYGILVWDSFSVAPNVVPCHGSNTEYGHRTPYANFFLRMNLAPSSRLQILVCRSYASPATCVETTVEELCNTHASAAHYTRGFMCVRVLDQVFAPDFQLMKTEF
jgi:hypothetical protein